MLNFSRVISFFNFWKPVHLRALFTFSMEVEQRAEEFYTRMGDRTSDISIRTMAYKLAREEKKHREQLEEILDRWRKLDRPIVEENRRVFENELAKKKIFFDEVPDMLSEEELIRYAIGQEEKMIKYYKAFRRRFYQPWKKDIIDSILLEEKGHIKLLKAYFKK